MKLKKRSWTTKTQTQIMPIHRFLDDFIWFVRFSSHVRYRKRLWNYITNSNEGLCVNWSKNSPGILYTRTHKTALSFICAFFFSKREDRNIRNSSGGETVCLCVWRLTVRRCVCVCVWEQIGLHFTIRRIGNFSASFHSMQMMIKSF